jgi:ABC-type uncharacterized transport system permease subunit
MIDTLLAIVRSGTPLIYVTLAAVLAQRAGIWHLGLEGLMIAGACAAVIGAKQTGSAAGGILFAIVVCTAGSALLWFTIEKLRANPIIAGLGLTGLGLGGTDLAVQAIYGSEAAIASPVGLPQIAAAGGESISTLVAAMPLVVAATWFLVRRTRFGLHLTASGEHPRAARAVGIRPGRVRLIALVLGGVLCALGGTELALGSLQIFSVDMTAGRGFMAFAAGIFGAGNPLGATAAALFFAAVDYLGIRAQLVLGENAPRQLILMLPYLATVAGVWLSTWLQRGRSGGPVSAELRDY